MNLENSKAVTARLEQLRREGVVRKASLLASGKGAALDCYIAVEIDGDYSATEGGRVARLVTSAIGIALPVQVIFSTGATYVSG